MVSARLEGLLSGCLSLGYYSLAAWAGNPSWHSERSVCSPYWIQSVLCEPFCHLTDFLNPLPIMCSANSVYLLLVGTSLASLGSLRAPLKFSLLIAVVLLSL